MKLTNCRGRRSQFPPCGSLHKAAWVLQLGGWLPPKWAIQEIKEEAEMSFTVWPKKFHTFSIVLVTQVSPDSLWEGANTGRWRSLLAEDILEAGYYSLLSGFQCIMTLPHAENTHSLMAPQSLILYSMSSTSSMSSCESGVNEATKV